MRKGTAVVVALAAIGGGYFAGKSTTKNGATGTVVNLDDGVERKRIPVSGMSRGPQDALVTIVAFSDFQCPYCGRVLPAIDKLTKDYAGKVRVFFKHYPLPFHQEAPLASQAALSAETQGKFWEMHDKLFANQTAIKRADLDKYAQDLGLDMAKFKADLDGGIHKGRVDADMALGQQVGVSGTPAFFINGRSLVGAQPYDAFKKIVDEEIATAQKLVAAGTPPSKLYDVLMEQAGKAKPVVAAAAQPAGPTKANVSAEVYKVPVGDAPTKGGKEPKVTIVEYSEFQCPYCGKVGPTVAQVLKTYGDDVQVAFKHYPLNFHPNAVPAALASEAAREQGKFWEMHDKLFANQEKLDRASLDGYAQELGLDMVKFKAFVDGEKGKAIIQANTVEATQFGVRGTPSFFINGRHFRGAQPFEAFKQVIDEELKKADDMLKAGTPRGQLYAALIKDGLDKAAPPPAPPAQPGQPQAGVAYKVDIGKAPTKGPKDALVTIVVFSEFQCPFCNRVEPTLNRIMDEYSGKVRMVWKDMPLPFHQNARPAATLARVAHDKGKFWEAHDKLFANQQALERSNLETYAGELGLNVAQVKAALDTDRYKKEIEADMAEGAKVGARGTPAFFINGVNLAGAQPYERFKEIIDAELKKAEALVAKGTPKARVYDLLMKSAKTEVAAAPAQAAPGGEVGPESDNKIWKVVPGSSPSRGPKNAPVTLVLFSDFECPFCTRVEPTITQLEKEYAGKIRVVWKNFPLEFHKNAKPAAKAALAAGEQGKFWEMHGKLFQNQRALDRPNLEKYAQELGLDMSRFKAALDGPKFDAQIADDMKEAASVEVTGTPASFINGRKIGGAYPYDTFKKIVEQELGKKGPAVAARRRG